MSAGGTDALPVHAADIERALAALRHHLAPTPLQRSFAISERVGTPVWLKIETTQPTRSFKVRGALYRALCLSPGERRQGLISASAGNHGQGVAFAAQAFGIPATVVVPRGANTGKVAAMRRLGAQVVEHGAVFADANQEAVRVAEATGAAFVHAYDDPLVIAGQGTLGWELIDQLRDVDTIFCGIGGGGLISGLAVAVKARREGVRIIGVEPEGAAAMHASRQAGAAVTLDRIETMADGLAASAPGDHTLAIAEALVDEIRLVDEIDLLRGIRALVELEHLLAEPAGAAAAAALLFHHRPHPGERIAVVVSGANIAHDVLVRALRTR